MPRSWAQTEHGLGKTSPLLCVITLGRGLSGEPSTSRPRFVQGIDNIWVSGEVGASLRP